MAHLIKIVMFIEISCLTLKECLKNVLFVVLSFENFSAKEVTFRHMSYFMKYYLV